MIVETQKGSATSAQPQPTTMGRTSNASVRGVIIAHLCNHVGAWGAGFVLAVDDLSLAAKYAYKALCKHHNGNVPLGTTQFVEILPNVWIANMIAQNGVDKSIDQNGCLVDYKALDQCLRTVFDRAVRLECNVHIPSGMGSGLAGGSERMIHDIITTRATSTTVDQLERQMQFDPRITLWEFQDTTAASYVGPAPATAPKQAVDNVSGTGDDIDTILDDL